MFATEMFKILNSFSLEIMRNIFKTYTTIILLMHSCLPKEILKQICVTDDFLHVLYDLGPCTRRDEVSYYSERIQGQNQNLEIGKLPLPTLQNLPSTDRLHYIMPLNKD